MQDVYAQTLRQIIVQHGRGVCEDPRQLKALLSDSLGQTGQHDAGINVLVLALENRVVQDLLISDALPSEFFSVAKNVRPKDCVGCKLCEEVCVQKDAVVILFPDGSYADRVGVELVAPHPQSGNELRSMDAVDLIAHAIRLDDRPQGQHEVPVNGVKLGNSR